MTATEVLRRLLDERGVEYFKHEDGEPLRKLEKADEPATSWHMGGASVCAVPIEGSDLFDLWIDHCTPEQAIAATVGSDKVEAVLRKLIAQLGIAADFHFARKYVDCIVEEYAGKLATLGTGTCKRVMDSIDPFTMWVCDHCGHPLDTSENFCGGCGRRIEQ